MQTTMGCPCWPACCIEASHIDQHRTQGLNAHKRKSRMLLQVSWLLYANGAQQVAPRDIRQRLLVHSPAFAANPSQPSHTTTAHTDLGCNGEEKTGGAGPKAYLASRGLVTGALPRLSPSLWACPRPARPARACRAAQRRRPRHRHRRPRRHPRHPALMLTAEHVPRAGGRPHDA